MSSFGDKSTSFYYFLFCAFAAKKTEYNKPYFSHKPTKSPKFTVFSLRLSAFVVKKPHYKQTIP